MRQPDPRRPLRVRLVATGLLILLAMGGLWGCRPLQAVPGTPVSEPTAAAAAPPSAAPPSALSTPVPVQPAAAGSLPAPSSPVTATQAATVSPAPTPGTKPARMLIPDLKLDVPVADMTWKVVNTAAGPQSEWEVPEYAAGWAVNSALLGEPNNVVISGHNNIFGRVFMAISQYWPATGTEKVDNFTDRSSVLNGRKIEMIGADGRRFNYVITGFYRFRDSGVSLSQREVNGKWMNPTGQARLTITTCWPPWSNTHRLIVVAEPVQ